MQLSEAQLATTLLAAPFLILAGVWLVGLAAMFRPTRVVAKKERM